MCSSGLRILPPIKKRQRNRGAGKNKLLKKNCTLENILHYSLLYVNVLGRVTRPLAEEKTAKYFENIMYRDLSCGNVLWRVTHI